MDLSPHAEELLGRDCRQGQCSSAFPCAGHPLVTCQLVDDPTEDLMNEPARIVNAAKGDLFLAPGNALGFVGAILAALRPSQHYTHMGIFVDDGVSVRHATASSEHLQEFANGSILGTKAPSNGFEPDALRYGWPGTLTQSVENAWAMTRPGLRDDRDQWIEDPDLKDPESGMPMRFRIDALSFDPVPVQHFDPWGNESWETRWPLVVKPCPDDEALFSDVRRLLHRVADAASAIRGHYRFYAYSDATIAFDPQYIGPPVYERTLEVGDPGATDCALEAVEETIPVMCSSLVWAAIERVRQGGTPIILDWKDEPTWKAGCRPAVNAESSPSGGKAPEDGLYLYEPDQRREAGEALHKHLADHVSEEIEKRIPEVVSLVGTGLSVASVLSAVAIGPLALVALGIGLSLSEAEELCEVLSDMPDDVANQVCNAFASDFCDSEATDSERWREDPGIGRSVSPDDLALYWNPPTDVGMGLYGYNVPAVFRPARRRRRRRSAWRLSDGLGRIGGLVLVNGHPVRGARVRMACQDAITGSKGYELEVPEGAYLATAGWQDPSTGWWWETEDVVQVPLNGFVSADFHLSPPRRAFRRIYLTGKADLVSEVAIGHDWWAHPPISSPLGFLGPFMADQPEVGRRDVLTWSHRISDDGFVLLHVDLSRTEYEDDADLDNAGPYSVTVQWTAAIYENGAEVGRDAPEVQASGGDEIPEDGSVGWTVSLESSGLWPEGARLHFTIENQRLP